MIQSTPLKNIGKPRVSRIDNNVADQEPFEEAGKIVFGENGCYPMVAFGTLKTLSAFKLLARAHNIDPEVANAVSKQIQDYESELKRKLEDADEDEIEDVYEQVDINDYVEKQYITYVDQSKEFMGIRTDIKPHPCARICYHTDLRYDIGLISLKPKKAGEPRRVCAFIEGATADNIGYCKNDLKLTGLGIVI